MGSSPTHAPNARRPQRVVIVGPVPPYRGGISHHTARLATALRELGHDVTVESWQSQYPRRFYKRPQVDAELTPMPGARFALRWSNPLTWARVAWRSRGADVLVFPWVTPFHAVTQRLLSLVVRPRTTAVMLHNVEPHERLPLVRPLTRVGLGGVGRLVCHAASLKDDLDAFGVRIPDVRVVSQPPLVPVEVSPLPERPPVRLLFLGFQRAYKGPDIAVEATGQLLRRGHDVRLTVAGERWDDSTDLRALMSDSVFRDRVTLIERYVGDGELAHLLTGHHLLLAPYRSATQSGVVNLALCAGRPVVATAVGGLPEVVIEGATGALSAPGDAVAFADAAERAIDDLDALGRSVLDHSSTWGDVARAILGDPHG